MSAEPIDLQTAIDHQAMVLAAAKTPEARRSAWEQLRAFIMSRPPQEVKRMEVERGLTR